VIGNTRRVSVAVAAAPVPLDVGVVVASGSTVGVGVTPSPGVDVGVDPSPEVPPFEGVGVALAFGLSTSLLPWLVMFPSMGYGLFGTHGPEGTRLFTSSLMTHAFFGLGLWIAVRVMKCS